MELANKFVTESRIKWAISSFGPYKLPGSGDISRRIYEICIRHTFQNGKGALRAYSYLRRGRYHILSLKTFGQSVCPHADSKGRSSESALHELVITIESFPDIEGAFKNINSDAINAALVNLKVDSGIITIDSAST